MATYAVVVSGICDVSTVVLVHDAADEDDAHLQALESAKSVPSDKWEHGEIAVSETNEAVLIRNREKHP